MGTDRQRSQYEGILRFDRRVTGIDAANTTATEDAPQAGPITADAGFSTEAVLVASGTPAAGDTLEIIGLKAGPPGANRCGFGWRESGAASWLGWDVPSVISRFENVDDASVVGVGFGHPDVIPMDSGDLLILGGAESASVVGVSKRVWSGGGYGSKISPVYSETANSTADFLHPRGVKLESGRILVYHCVHDLTNTEMQVRMLYTDDGLTFTEGEAGVLAFAVDLSSDSCERLRVARSPDTGQFLMTIELLDVATGLVRKIRQFASRDGARFVVVGADVTITQGHDTACAGGFFLTIFDTAGQGNVKRLGSAFAALSAAPNVVASQIGTNSAGNGFAIVASDSGTIYVYGGNRTFGISDDAGATWNTGAADIIRWNGAGTDPTNVSGAWYRGQVVLVMNQTTPAANALTISAMWLGGYADLTLPPERISQNVGRQMFWQTGWVAHDPPASFFVDNGTGGGPTVARLADGSYRITNTAGTTAAYDDETAAGAAYIETIAEAYFEATAAQTSLIVRSGETATPNHTQIAIDVSGTSVQMFDVEGSANIGAAAVIVAGSSVGVRIAVKGRAATAWYQVVDDTTHTRQWIKLSTTATLTETGAGLSDRVRLFAGASSETDWFSLAFIRDGENVATVGRSMAADVALPSELFARGLPASGGAYVNDDVSIRGIDGPLLRGTEFSLELVHPSPVESIFPFEKASPRQVYQSASAAADQEIAFSLTGQAEEAHAGNDVIGVYVGNSNAQNVRLEGRNAAGAYSVITDISRAETGLAYIRSGNTVYPDEFGATVVGEYYNRDELAGSYFILSVGSGDTRTIIGNTEGHWSRGSSVAEKRCVIYLDDAEMDGTELTAGLTGAIVHRDTITYIHLKGSNTFRGYKLTLNDSAVSAVDAPPGGKFRVGVAVVGPIAVFGKRQDAEYSITRSAQVETEELTDGTMRTRILAPSRRTVVVNFADGTDVTTARGPADPDYVSGTTSSGAEPIAHNRDVPLMIDGLLDEIDGAASLVVYCPNIPAGAGSSSAPDVVTLRAGRAGGAVYGRIVGVVTQSAVVGDPMISEVLTGGSLTIREEV